MSDKFACMERLQYILWICDSSREDYHSRNRARQSYISVTREMGNGVKGELVYKFSTEHF